MDDLKPSILYVDDEAQNLEVFKAAYRKYYNIFIATTAKEAINILHKETITVILTDQRMPDMTGVQFLEAIIPSFPDPIRILISGYSDADAIINAINRGHVFRFISKPWDEQELKLSIDMAVKIYMLNKRNHQLIQEMHEKAIEQERVLSLFKKYVPSKIVEESIKEDPEHLFDGELRVISVLFATIEDINQFTEKHDSKQVLKYLNQYFSIMANCIAEHKGIVDKVVGGSILGIFGSPVSYLDNTKNAVFAGLSMLEELKKFNSDPENKINLDTKIGIGIHSGEAIVGNIGSQQYITYTAIGDTVNTASRIVELTKGMPNIMLVSEAIQKTVKNDVASELYGEKTIRGKEEPMNIYKIFGPKI